MAIWNPFRAILVTHRLRWWRMFTPISSTITAGWTLKDWKLLFTLADRQHRNRFRQSHRKAPPMIKSFFWNFCKILKWQHSWSRWQRPYNNCKGRSFYIAYKACTRVCPCFLFLHRLIQSKTFHRIKKWYLIEKESEKCYTVSTIIVSVSKDTCGSDRENLSLRITSGYIVTLSCTRNVHQKSNCLLISSQMDGVKSPWISYHSVVPDGKANAEKACISKHFLASDVTSRC